MTFFVLILSALLLVALATALVADLLVAAIWLALLSVLTTIAMFYLNSPLAAVFELSICAGLITVIFISTISLTRLTSNQEKKTAARTRLKKYIWLPMVILVIGIALYLTLDINLTLPLLTPETDVRKVIWNLRRFDLLGMLIILLVGVFGVVVLFKEKFNNER